MHEKIQAHLWDNIASVFPLYSYNLDKLASTRYFLFSSCGTMDEAFWAQTNRFTNCDWIRYSKWNFHWIVKSQLRFQFCWFLSGNFFFLYFFTNRFSLELLLSCWLKVYFCYLTRWLSWQLSHARCYWKPFSWAKHSGGGSHIFWKIILCLILQNIYPCFILFTSLQLNDIVDFLF